MLTITLLLGTVLGPAAHGTDPAVLRDKCVKLFRAPLEARDKLVDLIIADSDRKLLKLQEERRQLDEKMQELLRNPPPPRKDMK